MTVTNVDRMRIGGSKVRSGCKTCKLRRIKCDEGKPGCERCIKAGRKCDGYAAIVKPGPTQLVGYRFVHYVDPQRLNHPDAAGLDIRARRALDFFRHQTAFQLDRPFTIDLWTKSLACFMEYEPAIKHGVIALAMLHENFVLTSGEEEREERRVLALQHYGKSIKSVVELNTKNSASVCGTTLVTCILFCLIESLQGHIHSASKHIIAGCQLLADIDRGVLRHDTSIGNIPGSLLNLLRRVLGNLGTQAIIIGDILIDAATIRNPRSSQIFSTTAEAMSELSQIIDDQMRVMIAQAKGCIDVDMNPPDMGLDKARKELDRRLSDWLNAYDDLLSTVENSPDLLCGSVEYIALLTLRVNYLMCETHQYGLYSLLETRYDQLLGNFQQMVRLTQRILELESQQGQNSKNPVKIGSAHFNAQRPVFSSTLGIIPAMFYTVTRCRHYRTRLQALRMLARMKRRESCWDSQLASRACQRFVEIEEQRIASYRLERQSRRYDALNPGLPDLDSSVPWSAASDVSLTDTTNMPNELRIDDLELIFQTEKSATMVFTNTHLQDSKDLQMEWKE